MSRWLACALVALASTSTASASPARLEIVGDACSLETLDAEVAQLASNDATAMPVRVETTRTTDGVQASIWFPDRRDGERGPRVVDASTCSQLTESIALVVAMTIDAPPASTVAPARETRPPKGEELAVVAVAEPSTPHATFLGVFVTGGSGISTHGARGRLVVGMSARRGAMSLGLEARADADEVKAMNEMTNVRVSRMAAAISGCVHRGSLGACGVASVGTIHGEGLGLRAARGAYTPMVSTGLRLTWEHTLVGPVALRAYAEAQVLATETTFDVDLMPVWKSERFEGSGGLGLLARFL